MDFFANGLYKGRFIGEIGGKVEITIMTSLSAERDMYINSSQYRSKLKFKIKVQYYINSLGLGLKVVKSSDLRDNSIITNLFFKFEFI